MQQIAEKLSTEEKMAIILEGLRREKNVSQICREHGISQAQYYKWRDRFLEGAKEGLENGKKSRVKQLEEKNGRAREGNRETDNRH
ncbi:transposase [Kosmotoga arenicorallina]|uniref:transposase n=1 Tax=Kosmotoga arenicorallina TaxID=688066 RepID=UPI000AE660E4|nr:transposase [Kosmotoga arenicorallina]